jgi:hypothetical protein
VIAGCIFQIITSIVAEHGRTKETKESQMLELLWLLVKSTVFNLDRFKRV